VYSISQPTTAGTQPQYLLKNLQTNRRSTKRYWAYQLQDATNADQEEDDVVEEEDGETDEPAAVPIPIPPRQQPQRERAPTSRVLSNRGERITF
jgi:hypothetical protein